MNKRIFAAILALAMAFALLPSTALAVDVSGDYPMDFTSTSGWGTTSGSFKSHNFTTTDAKYPVSSSDPSWRWNHTSRTLTLNGPFTFTTHADIALKLPADSTIIVSGTNSFTANNDLTIITQDESYGIRAMGALTVTGSGSLSATGAWMDFFGGESYGVHAAGGIEVTDVALTGTGKESGDISYGVSSTGNIRVSGAGALTGTSGTSTSGNSIGACAPGHDIAVESGSRLNGAGDGAGQDSCGIECSSLRVTGGGSRATGASRTADRDSMAMRVIDQTVSPFGPGTITGNVLAPAGGVLGDWAIPSSFPPATMRTVLAANGQPATAATVGIDDAAAIPKTGDSATPCLWAGLILLAGAGLIVLRRKRRA